MNFELDNSIDWKAAEKLAEEEIDQAKRERKPAGKFAVIDAETDPFNGEDFVEPFIWGFYDGEIYKEFAGVYCTENLVEYIKDYKGNIFAHNGGKFDFHFLIEYLDTKKSLTVINGRIARAKLGKATLRDSYCLLPVPLAQLEKNAFDYNLMKKGVRELPENDKLIREYLESDCVYLYKHIKEFIDLYGLNLTLAGTALNEWKNLGGFVPRSNAQYYDKFLPHYYGGRVQPFQAGIFKGNYKVYDIKSAYPTAMKYKHPIGTDYYETKAISDTLLPNSFLSVECESFGAFPLRSKTGLSFPNKTDTFHVTGWEFIKALETGTIRNHRIVSGFVFTDLCDFSVYVDHFYAMKLAAEKNNDKTRRTFAKLFLNSLYGKFAANPENYEEFYFDEFGSEALEDYFPCYRYGDHQLFSRPLPDNKHKFLNVATAASITGWVRAYLWESINKCENVLYCDTDSIICGNGSALKLGDQLGDWEIEGEADKVCIAGKKMYSCFKNGVETKKACKGVRLTGKEIERVARGETVTYKSEAESFSLKREKTFIERKVKKTVDYELCAG